MLKGNYSTQQKKRKFVNKLQDLGVKIEYRK